jgi:hypothetical protein
MACTCRTKPALQVMAWEFPALRVVNLQIWLALLMALALALRAVAPAWAQAQSPEEELRIQHLRLQVLAEYDDARVLVIGQGRLAGGTGNGPQEVSLWIPQGAQINQISGMMSAEGELAAQPYSLQPDPQRPGWALLTTEIDSAHFFYEYYYDGLESDPADASRKTVAFAFTSPLPVERLSLEFLQPRGASDFSSDPPATSTRQDARYGFSYHQVESGPLAVGQELVVQVRYIKSDPALSVERQMPAMAGASAAEAAGAGSSQGLKLTANWREQGELPPWLALLLGGVTAAGVIGLSGFRYRSAVKLRLKAKPAVPASHCPVCGRPQSAGAFYCYRCGSLLAKDMKPGSGRWSQAVDWDRTGKEGR